MSNLEVNQIEASQHVIFKQYMVITEQQQHIMHYDFTWMKQGHDRRTSDKQLHLLDNKVLAGVWVCHCAHFRHNYPVCCHICFVGVTPEKSAPVRDFSCGEKRKFLFIVITPFSTISKNKVSLMRLDAKSPFPVRTIRGRTIFEGKAVHEGHAVEPVLVAGLAHGEQTRAIAQQCALQPAGNVPCAKENANGAIVGIFESEKSLTGREVAEEVVSPFTSAFWGSGCSSAFLVKSTGMVAHRHWRWATWGVRVNSARLDRAANHSL